MARKTLTYSGPGRAVAGCFLIAGVGTAIVCFCAFAVVFIGARADGGADPNASASLRTGIVGMAFSAVFAVLGAVPMMGVFVRTKKGAGFREVIAGLGAWAARHGWEVTDDLHLAAHWATRFHFSADELKSPLHAARGWVHGRDAMILYCVDGTEKGLVRTIIVVDADADYPVTAVLAPSSGRAPSHGYGSEFQLESIEFDRRWRVMGRDAAGSHAVFTPRVIERLLEPTPGGQPDIVWEGPGIRAADDGFIADPMLLESRLLLLADLVDLTPAYQVTHTNDDPSLRPHTSPPMLRIPLATVKLVALGAFLWLVGRGLAAGLPTAIGKWVVGVSVVIGLVLMIRGVLLTTRSRARELSQWRARQASALGPPPTDRPPPAP